MALSPLLDRISLGKIVQIRERILKAQAAGKKVYRFESGDPDFSLSPDVLDALCQAAKAGKTHYIPNNGIPELKKALFEKITKKNRIPIPSADNIFVTNGAMHALYISFACLLAEGDEVIVPDPMWTEVVENIKLSGGVPVGIPLSRKDQFQYAPKNIAAKITPRTRAIFINTPHNPTGAVLSRETQVEIAELARKHDLYVVSDEAYEDVIFPPAEHHSIGSLCPDRLDKIISIFSFSKSHAMSGLRVGYIATTDKGLNDRLPKILRCTINGVNSVAQWTAAAATTGDQSYVVKMREEYRKRRDHMFEALQGIPGVKPFLPAGTFFMWAELDPSIYARLGVKNSDDLSNTLAEKGIGSSPGDCFGESCRDAIRFSFSCSTEMVIKGCEELRKFLLG